MSDESLKRRMDEHDQRLLVATRRIDRQREEIDYLLDAVRALATSANVHIGQRPRVAKR